MKFIFLLALAIGSLSASDLKPFIHTFGETPDGVALPSTYSFTNTDVGASSTIYIRLRNTSTTEAYLVRTVFLNNSNFSVSPIATDTCVGTGGNLDFTMSFVPQAVGQVFTPIQISYATYPASSGCSTSGQAGMVIETLTTVSGTGFSPTLDVSLTLDGTSDRLLSGTMIALGNVQIGATKTATFTVTNNSSSTLAVSVPALVQYGYSQSPYALSGLDSWPSTLASGASASFQLTFSPSQQAQIMGTLTLGEGRTYPLSGTGTPGQGLESLLVSYTLPSGVRYSVSTARPIDFGAALTGSTQNYILTVSNPSLNFSSQTISKISISGNGFSLSGLPILPVTLDPGASTAFTVVYAPVAAGAQSAILSLDALSFTLSGMATAPVLNPSFIINPAALTSSQQATIGVQLGTAAAYDTIGTLKLEFNSAVPGIDDDPAIVFTSTGGRTISASFAEGSIRGAFSGAPAMTFQTGTTAGTVVFTLSFASGETYTKSFDITPQPIQISSASGSRAIPYITLNLSGFDNTYSAGKIVFYFYDTRGNALTPGGIVSDTADNFHSFFFDSTNVTGGLFSLQAKFPITGDITQIGSADIQIQNSSGQSALQKITF